MQNSGFNKLVLIEILELETVRNWKNAASERKMEEILSVSQDKLERLGTLLWVFPLIKVMRSLLRTLKPAIALKVLVQLFNKMHQHADIISISGVIASNAS